jgi:FkbH-like protein
MISPASSSSQPSRSPADYVRQARALEASGRGQYRLAILSSFTAKLLRPFLVVEGDDLGARPEPWFAPFGQFESILADEDSPLWSSEPEIVWIALRVEDIDRDLQLAHPEIGADAVSERLDALIDRILGLVEQTRARTGASLLVSNLAPSSLHPLPAFDASDPDGFTHLLAAANRRLARRLARVSDAHVFDYQGIVAQVGMATFSDPRLFFFARAASGTEGQVALARGLARACAALVRPPLKCVVVDLDGTLWGGVVGDDGVDNLGLGDDHPGNAFKEFQAALRALRRRGFLLAVASKNERDVALKAIDEHPEMLLRSGDFACIEASWDPKPEALRRIARELNIGLDSMLFVDDNPAERAMVRAELPEVRVLELPREATDYVRALSAQPGLERPRLLEEDVRRADMVARDRRRGEALRAAESVDDALARLHMVARVGPASEATLERIHQLIQKTNQFNLTTRRHKLEAIRRLAAHPEARVAWLRLRDRFGDLGLVCVGIVRKLAPSVWELDTLLMSCRVMGRRVETAFLRYLAERAALAGATRLRGVYRETAKNRPVRGFYPAHGFSEVHRTTEAIVYEADLDDLPAWPPIVAREDEEGAV